MIAPQLMAGLPDAPPALEALDMATHVSALEARLIKDALSKAGGNRTRAAELLGISRNGLAIKIEKLGLRD